MVATQRFNIPNESFPAGRETSQRVSARIIVRDHSYCRATASFLIAQTSGLEDTVSKYPRAGQTDFSDGLEGARLMVAGRFVADTALRLGGCVQIQQLPRTRHNRNEDCHSTNC